MAAVLGTDTTTTVNLKFLRMQLKENPGNLLLSFMSYPSSLARVLLKDLDSYTEETDQALTFNQFISDIRQGIQDIMGIVNRPGAQHQLKITNRIFGAMNFGFPFPEMEELDFAHAAEESRNHINSWVVQMTEGKITELLQPDTVESKTLLILANAIYFKGNWASRFSKEHSKERPFRVTKSESKPVQMMYQKATFKMTYIGEIFTQILVLPYAGQELNMIIMLPDEDRDLKTVESALTDEKFMEWTWVDMMNEQEVEVLLPQFKVEGDYKFQAKLDLDQAAGDLLSRLSGRRLDQPMAVHKSLLEVNEEGTEAAAATGATVEFGCGKNLPRFCADHPFLFFIRDSQTQSILFCGRISSP